MAVWGPVVCVCVLSLVCTGPDAGLLAGTALAPIEFLGFTGRTTSSTSVSAFLAITEGRTVQWTRMRERGEVKQKKK